MADDVDVLRGWARTQAAVYRKDRDVVEVEARLIFEDEHGRLDGELVDLAPYRHEGD